MMVISLNDRDMSCHKLKVVAHLQKWKESDNNNNNNNNNNDLILILRAFHEMIKRALHDFYL